MKLKRLAKELSNFEHKHLKGRSIRKVLIEKGETKYAIQLVFAESVKQSPTELTFFIDIDDTEIINFEEEN